jgi:hypothetical protein
LSKSKAFIVLHDTFAMQVALVTHDYFGHSAQIQVLCQVIKPFFDVIERLPVTDVNKKEEPLSV